MQADQGVRIWPARSSLPVDRARVAEGRRLLLAAPAALLLTSGCGQFGIKPKPLSVNELQQSAASDREVAVHQSEPIRGALTIEEAMARALKHNLDRRSRLMEEALAMRQLDAAQFDMLPRVLANAGYAFRDNDKISLSRNTENNQLSPSRFISQDRERLIGGLDLSWSLLDFGMGYYGARQQADRVLIAGERRRKAMQQLILDVRTAYWRAAAAQRLRDRVQATVAIAEDALQDARSAEGQRARNPIDSLRYQRQLLENLRLLESISQELATAQVELAQLINVPVSQRIILSSEVVGDPSAILLTTPVDRLESLVLMQNPDLREAHYNSRIARDEVRRTIARLFPNVSFNWGAKYDSDSYLINREWQEAGLQVSFNLLNVVSAQTQKRLAEAGVQLADQRRVAMQIGAVTQMYLARLALRNAREQYARANAIYDVDNRIAELVQKQQRAQAQSKLDAISNATTATLSLLRRYQALAQLQAAESRMIATLGIEPQIGSTDSLSLQQLAEQLRLPPERLRQALQQ
jgi:outer membrane protein TolC